MTPASLYASGLSVRQVAARLGCSATQVLRLLEAAGVKRRSRRLMADPVKTIVVIDASMLRDVRRVAGPGNVSRWIRGVVARELARGERT